MKLQDETRAKGTQAVALAAAYLLGIGTGLLVLGGFTAGRGFVVAGAVALAAALGMVALARGRRGAGRPQVGPPVAWAAAPSLGQELPTVSDYYANAPDGPSPRPSQVPYRRWEPLPPEGTAADPVSGAHRVVG